MIPAPAHTADISGWDVSKANDMGGMFAGARAFNQDIGRWDVSKVTKMRGMLSYATAFTQDLSGWNVCALEPNGLSFFKVNNDAYVIPAHFGSPILLTSSPRPTPGVCCGAEGYDTADTTCATCAAGYASEDVNGHGNFRCVNQQ